MNINGCQHQCIEHIKQLQGYYVLFFSDDMQGLNQDAYMSLLPKFTKNSIDTIKQTLKEIGFEGKKNQIRTLGSKITGCEDLRVICVGLGNTDALDAMTAKSCGLSLGKHISKHDETCITIAWPKAWLTPQDNHPVHPLLVGIEAGCYRFDRYKTKSKPKSKTTFYHVVPLPYQQHFSFLLNLLLGQNLAKDLMNEPANILTPKAFTERILELDKFGVKVTLLDCHQLEKENMHALLSVGKASIHKPYLAIMEWSPSNASTSQQPLAFVGKGICFDTGGINLKPSGFIEDMHHDMGGSAAVVGAMLTIAKSHLPKKVVGVVALAENSIAGNATRPSDIISSRSGKSIYIGNTDAEGRLILADAIDYTIDRFKPESIIDLATLTGACVIALGSVYAGLFSNNDILAKSLIKSGTRVDELLWRLPLHKAYDQMIDSPVADVSNIGNKKREAGAITAAQFLQRFVKNNTPWAHLDIAGTAFGTSDPVHGKHCSGFGVAILADIIKQACNH
ncbi:MAG: leucyl aminopeptidase [Pseudomonadota bacterium]|nr:leucyl aminopeptidase [Pseudomonadota bacterium]